MAQHVLELSDANFNQEVLQSSLPVLVDFWAPWCGPCRAIAPHVEALAGEYNGKMKVGKVNVDENPASSSQYGIRSIPTLLIFKNGKPVDQVIGGVAKSQLEEVMKRHM